MTAANLDPTAQADLARLFVELSQDPKTRKKIGKLVREFRPNTPHATAFNDVELEDKFESFKEQQAAERLESQQNAILAKMNADRARLLTGESGRQYAEDDVKKIEALMQRKGITDYEDGATLYAATLPPVDPRPSEEIPQHGSTWEFPSWDQFAGDPIKASRNEAHAAITELMRKRR